MMKGDQKMREILFRAKRLGDGEWGKGCLFIDDKGEKHEILIGYVNYRISWEVDPKTVGQFTGLTDTNGKKIFEGDIVHVHDCLLKPSAPYHEFDGVIEHRNGSFVIVGEHLTHYRWIDYDVTVLGNIHDNPELLGGEQ